MTRIILKVLSFAAIVITAATLVSFTQSSKNQFAKDNYVRDRTLLLLTPGVGSCTGIKIISPKEHKAYVLTAAHCHALAITDIVTGKSVLLSRNENGDKAELEVLEVNVDMDMMLLSSPYEDGLNIADKTYLHQHVHSITWGMGMPPFRTDGEILFPETLWNAFGMGGLSLRTITTMPVIPGSSGGPMLNDNNELVGVVLALFVGTPFTQESSLSDIKTFLGDR